MIKAPSKKFTDTATRTNTTTKKIYDGLNRMGTTERITASIFPPPAKLNKHHALNRAEGDLIICIEEVGGLTYQQTLEE
jgi:hypothetical protein